MKQRETSSKFLIEQPPTKIASQEATITSAELPTSITPTSCSVTSFEPEMIFCMGLPGAGKSTLARNLFQDTHTFIDPDSIKESHPEYTPENSAAFHAWSKEEEEKQFMAAVTGKQGRWVIDGTGVNAEALVRRMNLAKSFGFMIKLFYVKVSLQTSLRRAAVRERKVPEHVIREKARNISTSFEICSVYADEIEAISNDQDKLIT